MDKNSEINWLYVISIKEFQNNLNSSLLKEVGLVSKLIREKLIPVIFKNLKLNLDKIKFNSNVVSIAHNNRIAYFRHNYKPLSKDSSRGIEDSLNDFISELNDIKEYTQSFYFYFNCNAGYYLYPLIYLFDNLVELKIDSCKIPFEAFANIGITLTNLKRLELENTDLIKSTTNATLERNIILPPTLTYLKIYGIRVFISALLLDPYEYILDKKVTSISYEDFILPNISVPTLKSLDFRLKSRNSSRLEEFLEVNPNIESLLIRSYNLNINSSLNSLKNLDCDECINFESIDQAFKLNSINSLAFSNNDLGNFENIRRLCQLCPNTDNISINFINILTNFQTIIDSYLVPILSYKNSLKALIIINIGIYTSSQILDFTKFAQIEKLKIKLNKGSVLNIKFENCKNLKRVELTSYHEKFTDEFKKNFDHYSSWRFKFCGYTVKGYKI